MLSKSKTLRQVSILFLGIGLIIALSTPQAFAFNWPWDQGHDPSDPKDPRETEPETCPQCCNCTPSPVFVKSGDYLLSSNDLTLTGNGPAVAIGRRYNSRDLRSGPLGRGWTFSYGAQLIPVKEEDGKREIVIRLPKGRRIQFTENADGTYTPPFGVTATLVKNGDGAYTFTKKDGTRHEFDADGKLTTIVDRNNNQLSFNYDGTGCLNGVTDASGRSFDITKNVNGKVSSITDPSGRIFNYGYDANGNLAQATDPLGNTTSFGYDSEDRLTSVTDARGNIVRTITYDDQDRTLTYTEGGETYTMTYLDGQTNKTDSQGNEWQYFYDEMGIITKTIDPLGNEVTQQPNGVDPRQYDWQVDANGNRYEYTYDERGNQTSGTDPLGNVTTYTYEPNFNQIATITDARGVLTKYDYDANGNLMKITRAFGAPEQTTTTYTYDQLGNRTSMTDGNGNTSTYTYDGSGNLLTTTDPLGNTTTFTYDARGNVLTTTDANNNSTSFQYDAMNRLIAQTDALGNTIQRVYDENGNLISETDANNNTTLQEYDAYNRLVKTTDPLGNVTTRTYNPKGKLSSLTDANGKVTYYKYDAVSRLTKIVRKVNDTADTEDVDDATTQYRYDNVGNLTSFTQPNGITTTNTYDAVNQLTSRANPLGETTSYTYDAVGNKLTKTLPNGNVILFTYDSLNGTTSVSDSIGLIVNYAYDAVGNRLSQADGNGNVTTYQYDGSNRLSKKTDAMGEETSYHYDNVGNLLTTIDREGNATSQSYDALNRRTSTTNALGAATTYQYDDVGNLLSITDANGNATDYEYDGVNRLVKETYADGGIRTFTYDGVGKMLSRTDQKGVVTLYEYNDLYFLTKRDYPAGPDDIFTYDKTGRMLTAEKGGWLVTFDHDDANRVIQTKQNGQTISYAYDIPARTRAITYPGGRLITEQKDFRGRLATIDDATSPPSIVQYAYDLGNRVTSRTYRNGALTSYTYNANNWILELEHSIGAARIAGFAHAYDKEGNKLFEEKRHDPTRSEAYQYDAIYGLVNYTVGQLTGSTIPTPATQTLYNLDPLSNWTTKTTDGVTETRSHNAVNEITAMDAMPIAHDNNGNLTDDGVYTYTYDDENRLTRVTRKADGQGVGEYQYDALGRRVVKLANPAGTVSETRYYYDDARVIEEENAASITEATYTYGDYIDEVLSMDRGGQAYYYHQNALWSIVAVTDGAANVVERCGYDAYGCVTITDASDAIVQTNPWGAPHSAIDNPYLFTGRRLDEETGLYYYRSRCYDCLKGRFLQRDPFGYVDGMNLYEYVMSNPVNIVDPTGTGCFLPCSSATAASGGVVAGIPLAYAACTAPEPVFSKLACVASIGVVLAGAAWIPETFTNCINCLRGQECPDKKRIKELERERRILMDQLEDLKLLKQDIRRIRRKNLREEAKREMDRLIEEDRRRRDQKIKERIIDDPIEIFLEDHLERTRRQVKRKRRENSGVVPAMQIIVRPFDLN